MTASQQTVRIGLVGPSNCGKTVVAEYYTELNVEPNLSVYNATSGVRIIESERKIQLSSEEAPLTIPIQIWDISGDQEYEPYYAKLSMQLDGVVIVVPAIEQTFTNTVKKYYKAIVDEQRVGKPGFVSVLYHKPYEEAVENVYVEDKNMAAIPVYKTSMDQDRTQISDILDELVKRIVAKNLNEEEML